MAGVGNGKRFFDGRAGLRERADAIFRAGMALDTMAVARLRGGSRMSRADFRTALESLRNYYQSR